MLLAAIQETPLIPEYVSELLKTASEEDKRNSLDYALRNKNRALLGLLIRQGVKIDIPDYAGQTVLHQAVQMGNIDFVKKVIELGADKAVRDYSYEKPLDIALRERNIEIVKVLLGEPNLKTEDIKKMPGYGVQSTISYAQSGINEKLIKFLVKQGINENEAESLFLGKGGNCNGWSFLAQYYIGLDSVGTDNEEEFYDILKCISRWDPAKQPEPFDVLLADYKDISPKIAKKYRTLGKLMKFTINDLAWFQHVRALTNETGITQQQRIHQWKAIKRLDEKIELKQIFSASNPTENEKKDVKELLEYARRWPGSWIDIALHDKSNPNDINKWHVISITVTGSGKFKYYDSNRKKRLPEIASAEVISTYITTALQKGTDITYFDLYRFYPSTQNIPDIVEPQIAVPADRYADQMSLGLLKTFANSGEINHVKRLLKEGGESLLGKRDEGLITSLSRLAVIKNDEELKAMLKNYKVQLTDQVYMDSASIALSRAEVKSFVEILGEKGELKAEIVNKRNIDDFAAIHLAIEQDDKQSVIDLIRLGANIELAKDHETPLFQAARLGNKSIAKLLIRNNANLDCVNEGYGPYAGFTPLHIAILNGQAKIVELLLQHGARIDLKDATGKTPFEIVPLRNETEIAKVIEKYHSGLLKSDARKSPVLMRKGSKRQDASAAKENLGEVQTQLLEKNPPAHKDNRK